MDCCARAFVAGDPSWVVAVVGMDGRRGEECVGKVPRENEIGRLIPRGQFSHFGLVFFFFADALFPFLLSG